MGRIGLTFLLTLTLVLVHTECFLFDVSSCQGRCDQIFHSTDDFTCQCNEHCVRFGDCCSDYQALCDGTGSQSSSCQGRCHTSVSGGHSCQCNSHCVRYNDCCQDYTVMCVDSTPSSGTCKSFTQMGQVLWDNDVNRLSSSDVTTNYQTRVSDGTSTDNASGRFFTHLDESKLTLPTYAAFLKLLDNYYPQQTSSEHATSHETSEMYAFLDAVLETNVMTQLLDFLICQSKVTSKSDLRSKLKTIWFGFYQRSSKYASQSSSGFEHVMVGEYKDSSTVSGFHSWLSFYQKEKAGQINYLGYVSSRNNPEVVGAAFTWGSHLKTKGSFFVGVSPEFDLAVYTLCYLTHMGQVCPLHINGQTVDIKTFDVASGHLATAYVM